MTGKGTGGIRRDGGIGARAAVLGGLAWATVAGGALAADAGPPTAEEMWRLVQSQQQEIERLRARLAAAEGRIDAAESKVEAAGDMIESTRAAGAGDEEGWWRRTHLSGYGELHYNGGDADEIDLHRFVFGIGHDFTDRLRLESEVEIEHALAGDGEPGEVAIEQAYVEYDLDDAVSARGGLFLIPVGILNETHEPPTFYGVERNPVERDILPTTWREAGVAARGRLGAGFAYDLALHSGLATPVAGANAYKIRNGRKEAAEAPATDPALTGRLKWTGMPGVELALAGQYQDDVTQNAVGLGTRATLVEAHVDLRRGPWGLRALAARWDLDDGPAFTGAAASGRDVQWGWYVEPSYRFDAGFAEIGLFTRFSQRDNEAGDSTDSLFSQFDLGANVWLHPDVVLKIDGQFEFRPDGRGAEDNRLNLGLGYRF